MERGVPSLLLLHGLGSSATDWPEQLAGLGPHCRLLLVDLPGHYRSALPPGRLTWADLETALRGRGIEDGLIAELGSLFGGHELENYSGRRGGEVEGALGVRERIARAAPRLARLRP